MWKIVLVASLSAVVFAEQSTNVAHCINNPGELPLNIQIEGCVEPPCLLPQLEDAAMNIVFKNPKTSRRLQAIATAYVTLGFITMPISYDLGIATETCNFLSNTYCPVPENEVVHYTLKMYIEPSFPVGRAAILEFQVVDADTKDAELCIRVPIRIEPPRNTIAGARSSQVQRTP